ncbi:MAG TPA: rhomboid family intramembrane serine protease [Chitinophagaceae bacterium]|nr:rhomboid family intramembrane serine protease [Chitinophagaceae bacterium]
MAYPEREYRQRISLGQGNNALTMLIIVNLVVFVLLQLIKVFFYFIYSEDGRAIEVYENNVLKWFTLPADLGELASRPWTVITHMFTHDGVWHILGNTLWLWAFGYILQDLTGNKKIFPLFIYGGLAGALAFLGAYNLLPGFESKLPVSVALGASAGIMAIAVSTTMISPGYRIFPMLNGGIPLWVITVLYLIVDLAMIPYDNPGGHIAHLGGAAMGFFFIVLLRRGYDWSDWMNNFFDWVNNLFNPDKPKKGRTIKEELFYRSETKPYKKTPNITQQRVDDILDKINQKGYHYLTEEEKELLKRASQEDL